jgi:hypothetical protein
MDHQEPEPQTARRPYAPPAVIYEAPLEVRAGTVIPSGSPGMSSSDQAQP